MALANPATKVDVSAALSTLEPPGTDQYLIAFGPGATQFCATPNGYSTTQLPHKVVNDLVSDQIKRVLHASFGSDANSFFFTYEIKDGSIAHRAGKNILTTLRSFVDQTSATSKECASSLRVQLGANGSYIGWAGSIWVSHGIPQELRVALHELSSTDIDNHSISYGVFKSGTLDNVAWHHNGSFYIKNGSSHRYSFRVASVEQAWKSLLHCDGFAPSSVIYVALSPHSPTGETFAFFKRTQSGQEPEFILRFEPEEVISSLHDRQPILQDTGDERYPTDSHRIETYPQECAQVVSIQRNAEGPHVFQWAVSKRIGRPHASDSWELDLRKGERIKILKYMGKDWFLAENRRKERGWVHRSSLDFQQLKPHTDPREAYARFSADIEKLLKMGNLCSFPNLSNYMNSCAKDACGPLKKGAHHLGICVHELHELLRGAGEYSLEMLKTERNKWHPDKFARHCHQDHRDALKEKAQALFVLFGVLMDTLENPPRPEPAVWRC